MKTPTRKFAAVLFASIALLAAAALVFGCSGCAKRYAEKKAGERVNALLPAYLGRADKYETTVKGENAGAIVRGHIQSVHVEGRNVRLDPAFVADFVVLDFSEVAVNTKTQTLENIGDAKFECRVGEGNVDRLVRTRRAPFLRDLSVALDNDQIVVHARPDVLGFSPPVPVSVAGTLTPRLGGTVLDFTPDEAHISIVPVPGFARDYVARKLNPAVELSSLRVPVRITTALVQNNYLVLRGTIAAADLRRAADSPPPRP